MSKDVFDAIKRHLTPDLLKKGYSGHCYVASEAYYHIIGKEEGFKPRCLRIEGVMHWWLQRGPDIIDITVDQFNYQPQYYRGKGKGFLTKGPSKRAQVLIDRACEDLGLDPEMIYEKRTRKRTKVRKGKAQTASRKTQSKQRNTQGRI